MAKLLNMEQAVETMFDRVQDEFYGALEESNIAIFKGVSDKLTQRMLSMREQGGVKIDAATQQ